MLIHNFTINTAHFLTSLTSKICTFEPNNAVFLTVRIFLHNSSLISNTQVKLKNSFFLALTVAILIELLLSINPEIFTFVFKFQL